MIDNLTLQSAFKLFFKSKFNEIFKKLTSNCQNIPLSILLNMFQFLSSSSHVHTHTHTHTHSLTRTVTVNITNSSQHIHFCIMQHDTPAFHFLWQNFK